MALRVVQGRVRSVLGNVLRPLFVATCVWRCPVFVVCRDVDSVPEFGIRTRTRTRIRDIRGRLTKIFGPAERVRRPRSRAATPGVEALHACGRAAASRRGAGQAGAFAATFVRVNHRRHRRCLSPRRHSRCEGEECGRLQSNRMITSVQMTGRRISLGCLRCVRCWLACLLGLG